MFRELVISQFALLAILTALTPSSPAASEQRGSAADQHHKESEALRRGGIRAAAAVTGHYIGQVSAEPENNVETLKHLVAWHELIVIGRIQSNRSWLTADGETIVTDYRVVVEKVLKGNVGSLITVSIPGGRVSFENGTRATLVSTMRAPLNSERYLLFLRPSWFPSSPQQTLAAAGPLYAPQHLALSVYYLDSQSRVTSNANPGHPLQRELDGKPEAEVVRAIAKLTEAR